MFFSVKLYDIINLHFLLLAKIVCVICVIVEYHPATHYLTKVKSSSPFHVAAVRLLWWSRLGIEDICHFLNLWDLFDISKCQSAYVGSLVTKLVVHVNLIFQNSTP